VKYPQISELKTIAMSKDTIYFSHDYNSRSDDKIKNLIRKHGVAGYGIFWCIIEDLYNNANALRLDYDCIAYDLRTDCDIIKSIINDLKQSVPDDGDSKVRYPGENVSAIREDYSRNGIPVNRDFWEKLLTL